MIKLIMLIVLTGCGGDSSIEQPEEQVIVENRAILYSYTVTNDSDARTYKGNGVSVNDIIYMVPTFISDSSFTVVGEISGSEVRLFSYTTRGLVVQFTDGDDSGYHLELNEVGFADPVIINNIPQQWFNSSYSGIFGDIVMTLTNNDKSLSGNDTAGCEVSGEIFEIDYVIGVDLSLKDCLYTGDYYGALMIKDNGIIGSVTSDNNGIIISYNF